MKKHWWRRNILYRWYMWWKALIANIFFWFPTKHILCLWITGTDGKSTTAEITYRILKQAWYKVWLLTTVSIDVGEGKQDNLTKLTTLSHRDFCRYMSLAKKHHLTHMVIEASSHALYQFRLRPVKFEAVGWTNLTHEHLDFHRTMDHYFRTKASLFTQTTSSALGIYPEKFSSDYKDYIQQKSSVKECICFGYDEQADIWVSDIVEDPYLSGILHYQNQDIQIQTRLLGQFNMDNIMIACAMTYYVGVSWEDIVPALVSFPGLAGRQEIVEWEDGITAMIDFALTPDALKTLYTDMGRLGYKRLIAVFGATGNRDKGKRPLMWAIATRLCDHTILTEDENYHEDGKTIITEIEAGIDVDKRDTYEIIQDRTEAIQYAINYANPWDMVIVTWMANFTSRAMNEWKIPWNERSVIEEAMKNRSEKWVLRDERLGRIHIL